MRGYLNYSAMSMISARNFLPLGKPDYSQQEPFDGGGDAA
jgi:hypothetical protein